MRYFYFGILLMISSSGWSLSDFTFKQRLINEKNLTANQVQLWQDDLLYPHLQQQWLSKNIRSISSTTANRFMNDPNNRAAAWFFYSDWWLELVRRQDWPAVKAALQGNKDATWACYYLQAQQALNEALDDELIKTLWLTGDSQPDHCDAFLISWIEQATDADELVWERQIKAFYARNSKLVRYLNRFYQDAEFAGDGQFLTAVYQDPKQIISKAYHPESSRQRELALAAVNRMAFKDPRSASNLWQRVVKVSPKIGADKIKTASRYLGIAMAKQALPEADYWLSIADPQRKDQIVQHWRLQIALAKKDFQRILTLYQQLDTTLAGSNQWLFWSGIAQLNSDGYLKDNSPLYPLSKRRLYYGFLAAGVLGRKPSLNSNPNYADVDLNDLHSAPALMRAKALYRAGELQRAQIEWNRYVRRLDDARQHAAAILAFDWGWYEKSSQAAGWSGRYDLIKLRYPRAFNTPVSYYSELLSLPEHWVYGVMRQESRFQSSAISPAGAQGLMQVMPATARQVSGRHQLGFKEVADLHVPETNIAIGSHYLSELITKYQHPVYATAAYNAGPSRVDSWQQRFPSDITIWIESIPFDETRNYVKSVMAYSQIYALTFNSDWQLASWLTPQQAIAGLTR